MKRNILTSDPAVPTSRYTFVLDFSDLYIAFSRTPDRFYFDGKETLLVLISTSDWQTANKKLWANASMLFFGNGRPRLLDLPKRNFPFHNDGHFNWPPIYVALCKTQRK